MSNPKLIALLLISFLATSSVVYNLRSRRKPQSSVVSAPPGTPAVPASDAPASAAPAANLPPPEPGASHVTIPQDGWGRNPFLTIEEINRANEPQMPAIVQTPLQRPVEPSGLPIYEVTGIISGNQGMFAIIGTRLLQAGDRLGIERVKEIKEQGVVLEYEGRTRELPLKRMEDVKATAPKKETKP